MDIISVKNLKNGWLVNNEFEISDPNNRHYAEVQAWIDEGNTPDPEFTNEEIAAIKIKAIESAIQSELDEDAKLSGYDNINTAVSYAGEASVGKFQTQGKAFSKRRSLAWEYAYATLASYLAGDISEPTIEEMITGMPARVSV